MRQEYTDWIRANVPENPLGDCLKWAEAMRAVFPELTLVRGHYYCIVWGQRGHWWLVAPDGKIVDPTADQFPTKGTGVYEPHVEGTKEPTGKCPNCGGYAYDHKTCCSEECAEAFTRYLEAETQ